MAEARKYVLKVTVGPNYDTSTHQEVKVNTSSPVEVSTKDIDASVNVRIQNYRGKTLLHVREISDPGAYFSQACPRTRQKPRPISLTLHTPSTCTASRIHFA